MDKNSFQLFIDYKEIFESLSDEQAGQLIKAIFAHEKGEEYQLAGLLRAVFVPIRQQLDRNRAAYEEKCSKNKDNAKKRWHANACERMQSHKFASGSNAKHADTDTDKDKNTDKDTDKDTDNTGNKESGASGKPTRFKKPSPDEIIAYCRERNNGIDGQAFFDFYESKGWRIGKEPMKDWKAAVRTWERRSIPQARAPPVKTLKTTTKGAKIMTNGP